MPDQSPTEVKPATCCSCGQQCGVLVQVEDGRVTRITGDKEHPISRGFIGRVKQVARLTETIHPQVIQADRWWYPERPGGAPALYSFWETNINVCTDDDLASCDPVMGSWLLRGLPCRLTKVESDEM